MVTWCLTPSEAPRSYGSTSSIRSRNSSSNSSNSNSSSTSSILVEWQSIVITSKHLKSLYTCPLSLKKICKKVEQNETGKRKHQWRKLCSLSVYDRMLDLRHLDIIDYPLNKQNKQQQ